MSEKQVRDYDKFMLRFPDGMRDAIAERAKANGRSMNSEIIEIISNSIFTTAIGDDAVGYILEMAKNDEISELSDEDRSEVMALLFQVAEKLAMRVERESGNLKQVLELITKNRKPT